MKNTFWALLALGALGAGSAAARTVSVSGWTEPSDKVIAALPAFRGAGEGLAGMNVFASAGTRARAVKGFAVDREGNLYRAAGKAWVRVEGVAEGEALALDFRSRTSGAVVGRDGAFLSTEDGGLTWVRGTVDPSVDLYAVQFVDARTGYAGGEGGALFATRDGGATWVRLVSAAGGDLHALRFTGSLGYAAGDGGMLLMTRDAGATWSRVATGSREDFRAVYSIGNRTVLVGASGARLESKDAGETWNARSGASSAAWYRAGTGRFNGVNVSPSKEIRSASAKTTLAHAGVLGSKGVWYVLPEERTVSLRLLDARGKSQDLLRQRQAAGRQQFLWPAEQRRGTYFLEIQAGDARKTLSVRIE